MQNPRSLPAELTIYTIGELRPEWLTWLSTAAHDDAASSGADECLCVAAGAVAEVDAAGVQLLLSLSNALSRQQRQLRLVEPSPSLVRGCTALGAAMLLDGAAPAGALQ